MIKDFLNTKKISRGIFTITGLFVFLIATNVNAVISDIQIDTDNIDENTASGTAIGTLSTTGGNSPYTYELTSGTGDGDNSKFTIDNNELKLNFTPDYENPTDLGDTVGNNTYATRVIATDAHSDFVQEQLIATKGAWDWEHFQINADHYLVVANYHDDSTYNINSKIYKWNGTSFAEFQSIVTSGATDWEYFTIGTDHYLAVANYYNGSTRNIDSKIYKWNGSNFIEYQSVVTNGARDWEYFQIDAEHYLVAANYYDDSTYNINSKIYKWNGSNFIENQLIVTSGARHWEHFQINTDHYLVVANNYDDSTYNINSKIYKWNGSNFIENQLIVTSGAADWEHFQINTDHYLVVANHYGGSTHNINSKIYKWNGSSFIENQSIETSGAVDWEYFQINMDHYLAVGNHFDSSTYNVDSKIYKWNGSNFIESQIMAISGTRDWEYFQIDAEHYLVAANYYDDITHNINSTIYKSSQEQYEKQLIISINDVVEEIIITNPDTNQIDSAITNGYITETANSATTDVQITFQSNTANAIFPDNTVITEVENNNFNFSSFITENNLSQVKATYPEYSDAIGAVRIGVSGIDLAFKDTSNNPTDITMEIQVSSAYNGMTMDVFSQLESTGVWSPETTCIITNGTCTFTTDHATTYVVNGDGSISGYDEIDINVEVQDTLSLDCYDKEGSSGDHDVNLGIVTAGTPITAESTCNVTTNDDQGYYLTVINSSTEGSTGNVLEHQDPNTPATWYSIDDLSPWVDTTIGTQNGLTSWTNGTTTGMGFSVTSFPEASLTNNEFENTWVDGTCGEASNQYAGIPDSAQTISAVTSYQETSTTTDICYKVDVSPSQQSGIYTGQVTYTATTDASSYHK